MKSALSRAFSLPVRLITWVLLLLTVWGLCQTYLRPPPPGWLQPRVSVWT